MNAADAGGRSHTARFVGWVVVGALALMAVVLAGPALGQSDCTRHCVDPIAELRDRVTVLETSNRNLGTTVEQLQTENDGLRSDLAALSDEFAALRAEVDQVIEPGQELNDRVTAVEQTVSPLTHDDAGHRLVIEGVNVEVVNGTGSTDGAPNGVGNLIIGYNAQRTGGTQRSGSHNLVVGDHHEWTHWGGIVAGIQNSILNEWASVTGGRDNIASGEDATVSGGYTNHASGRQASVSGGHLNNATGFQTSVSGGLSNTAVGIRASVSGGESNSATGTVSSVSGGEGNTAGGGHSSILGGFNQVIESLYGHYPN